MRVLIVAFCAVVLVAGAFWYQLSETVVVEVADTASEEIRADIAQLTFSNTQTWNPDWYVYIFEPRTLVPDAVQFITIPEPPTNTSTTTQAELALLTKYKSERSAEKQTEIEHELEFMGVQFGSHTYDSLVATSSVPETALLFTNVLDEMTTYIMIYKEHFDRVRPSYIDPTLEPTINVPNHPAYPSGHSTQAHIMAHVLADLFPEEREDLFQGAARIARNREIAGVHYPSDSAAGASLALQYYNLLKETAWYQMQIELARAEWTE